MSIIRRASRERGFTVLDNAVLNDSVLSFKALGLLTFILSKPDNWSINSIALAKTHRDGRDATRGGLAELVAAGYIRYEKKQDDRRRWVTETVVYDYPQNRDISMSDGFSGVGKPGVGKPGAITSTDDASTEEQETGDIFDVPRKRRRLVLPDDHGGSDDEQPAVGETKRDRAAEQQRSASRGSSASGLAYRFRDGMREAGKTMDATNVNKLRSTLVRWEKAGTSVDLMRTMVDLFTTSPKRYTSGDQVPWVAFIAARERLAADAAKKDRALKPASERFKDVYEGLD